MTARSAPAARGPRPAQVMRGSGDRGQLTTLNPRGSRLERRGTNLRAESRRPKAGYTARMQGARATASVLIGVLSFAGGARLRVQAQSTVAVDPALLGSLRWRSIGPANTGGRIDDFAVARVPGQPDAIYVATAGGGVFKSTNQGTSWLPIFDRVDAMMSIGDVAVAPSNANIVWAGTGESNNRQSSSWGDGVYKSVDGG